MPARKKAVSTQKAHLTKQEIEERKNYADYLFEHAGPAIMSWIIEGAKKAIDKDFHTSLPDVVEAAIQAYREDNDWLGQFLEHRHDQLRSLGYKVFVLDAAGQIGGILDGIQTA